jgi:AcrR family transcriptional regulator
MTIEAHARAEPVKPVADGVEDSAKRQQIVEGARKIFLAQGFDAASMNDIARSAGVSKGTLYVYFQNKEQLFEQIVYDECSAHAEGVFKLDHNDHDVEGVLMRLGMAYVPFLCRPAKAAALRAVAAIADRMPEIGKMFYETGPKRGIGLLADYMLAQTKAGVLTVEHPDIAAAQFLDSCQSTLFKPVLFNFAPPPDHASIERVVTTAVRTFMAAYRAK